MGFNFRKSIKVGPARINLSKSGIGYSVGAKGFRISKSPKRKAKASTQKWNIGFPHTKNHKKNTPGKTATKHKSQELSKQNEVNADRKPIEKSWFMAIAMAVIGFAVVAVVSFLVILILYFIIDLFTKGELPTWANWLILVATPVSLGLLAGYFGFTTMKPEKAEDLEQSVEGNNL